MGSNTREVVFGLVGITILAVAVWVMFNQADPSEKDDPAPASTEASETISKLPTRVPGISNRDETSSPSQTPGPTPISTNILAGQRLLLPAVGEELPNLQSGPIDPKTYIVKEGDTLYGLSQEFGVSVEALMEANSIEDQNRLFIGLRLQIPDQIIPQP